MIDFLTVNWLDLAFELSFWEPNYGFRGMVYWQAGQLVNYKYDKHWYAWDDQVAWEDFSLIPLKAYTGTPINAKDTCDDLSLDNDPDVSAESAV